MAVDRSSVPSAWGSRRAKEALSLGRGIKSIFGGDWGPAWTQSFAGATYGGSVDYAAEAGDLALNSIVMICINWITTNYPEAPLQVLRRQGADEQPVPDHPLTLLLADPNPDYSGALLWQPTLLDYNVNGNAYWLKAREGRVGSVRELRYEPSFSIRAVRATPADYISYYEIYRDGYWVRVERNDVVHFRNGLNPRDPRYGLGPLASALREVFTDNEAARFTAIMLRNLGMPGAIVMPADAENVMTPAEADLLKATLQANTTGDRRGLFTVLTGPMKIDYLSRSPADMQVDSIRDKPEERVPGLLGIHPAVVGLGVGLEHSTYSNMDAAIAAAYRNNIVPTATVLDAELTTQLLPELGDRRRERVAHNWKAVTALSENQDAVSKRAYAGYGVGVLKLADARRMLNLPTDASEEVYRSKPAPVVPPQEPPVSPLPEAGDKARHQGRRKAKADPAGDLAAGFARALAPVLRRQYARLHAGKAADPDLTKVCRRWIPLVMEQGAEDAADELGLDLAFDLEMEEVQEVLDGVGDLVTDIETTTRDEIRALTGQAAREGWGPAKLAAALEERARIGSQERSVLIARTESARAYSDGAILSYERSGVVSGCEWLVTEPCPQCAELDGLVVPLGKEFAPGITRPPAHPACRCALAPVLKD